MNLKKTKIIYGIIMLMLFLGICSVYYCIVVFHFDNKALATKNKNSLTYEQIKVKKTETILNKEMKQWLQKKENLNKNYYRIIVKGYGSTGSFEKGFGIIKSNIKKFYMSQGQFQIEGNLLKFNGMIFCGNWEIIPIEPQEYIYNIITDAFNEFLIFIYIFI